MTEPFYLGAYWGPRAESVDACADRLAACLSRIGSLSPLAATWYRKGRRRSAAKQGPIATDVASLRGLLLGGVNRRDFGGEAISELGFSLNVWNGDNRAPIALSVTCGASPPTPGVMNTFVLNLPAPQGDGADLYAPATARAMMLAVVEAWEPNWATFASHRLRELVAPAPRQPVTGWITYLSTRGRKPVPTHVDAVVEPAGEGVMLVTADSVDDLDGADLRGLAATLEQAGTLTPTP